MPHIFQCRIPDYVLCCLYYVNELDIPKEYLEVYQSKITERETVKQSLLTLDASTAKSELESKYQEYHDYFENTYIAMLGVISKFWTNAFSSNDLDSAWYHQQVESIATQIATISIDEKWVITGPTDQMTEMQKGLFYAWLASQKIDGKTIIELAKSSDEIDKGKAIRAAKQIVKSILEAEILSVDDDWNIQDIRHGEDKTLIGIIQLSLTKRMKKNITDSVYFDASKYEIEETTTDDSKIEIKTLTEEQEKITAQTDEIQKAIESTEPDLVYPGRGLVTFDPEKNLLTSRWKSVEIDPTALKIKWFYTVFKDLQELLYTANIVNRFKYKYPGMKDFYFGSRMRSAKAAEWSATPRPTDDGWPSSPKRMHRPPRPTSTWRT